jgi:hypothetical protein
MYLTKRKSLAKDVREVIDEELAKAGETYVAGLIAERVVQRLHLENPELLAKFLDQHAVQIITSIIGQISRQQKSYARATAGRRTYKQALDRYEKGDEKALGVWLDTMYVVTTGDQRKRLGDMYQSDLEYAINDYTDRARANTLQATFLKAIAAKVGAKRVGEVFTDEELARMWNSLL